MGLFGAPASFSRLGTGEAGAAAHEAVERIAGRLEQELQDTPGEYLVLQAAGMLFASQNQSISGIQPVHSLDEAFARAWQIMARYSDSPTTPRPILETQAATAHRELQAAAAAGVESALMVGQLNSYLHFVANGYLQRNNTDASVADLRSLATLRAPEDLTPSGAEDRARGRSGVLIALLALPVLVGIIGLIVVARHPELKAALGRLFVLALALSGAGQAWFFHRRWIAALLAIGGVVVVALIH